MHPHILTLPSLYSQFFFRSEIRVEKTQSPHSPTPTSSAILRCSCPFLMEVFRSPPLDAAPAAAPVRKWAAAAADPPLPPAAAPLPLPLWRLSPL